jgi:hypothetical protein
VRTDTVDRDETGADPTPGGGADARTANGVAVPPSPPSADPTPVEGLAHPDVVALLAELCSRLGADHVETLASADHGTALACVWPDEPPVRLVVERGGESDGTGGTAVVDAAPEGVDSADSDGRWAADLVVVPTPGRRPPRPRRHARAVFPVGALDTVLADVGADDLRTWVRRRTRPVPRRPLTVHAGLLGASAAGRLVLVGALLAGFAVPVVLLWLGVALWLAGPTLVFLDSRQLHAPRGLARWLFVGGAAVPLVGILVLGAYGARRVERYEYVPDETAAPTPPPHADGPRPEPHGGDSEARTPEGAGEADSESDGEGEDRGGDEAGDEVEVEVGDGNGDQDWDRDRGDRAHGGVDTSGVAAFVDALGVRADTDRDVVRFRG